MGTDLGFGRLPEGTGASAEADQALVSDQAAPRLAPSGFDPSRVLAERCEQATGGDDELAMDIARAVGCHDVLRDYTRSIDAAMTLVPEGWQWAVDSYGRASCFRPEAPKPWPRFGGLAPCSPSLALCAAALRARGENS